MNLYSLHMYDTQLPINISSLWALRAHESQCIQSLHVRYFHEVSEGKRRKKKRKEHIKHKGEVPVERM